MKGTTIFSAYLGAEQKLERHPGPDWDRIARQSATFFADIVGRLKVSDTCRKVWNAERGTPEQIITALFGLSSDEDHFWSGLVARLRTDTAQIVDQKAKIAELEAKYAKRTKDFIEWIDYTSSVSSGTSQDYRKARRKMEQLEKEVAEASHE